MDERLSHCPQCGTSAGDGNFCGSCGADLRVPTAEVPPTTVMESVAAVGNESHGIRLKPDQTDVPPGAGRPQEAQPVQAGQPQVTEQLPPIVQQPPAAPVLPVADALAPYPHAQPQYPQPAAPSATAARYFVGDYVRDASSFLALLIGLFLPWRLAMNWGFTEADSGLSYWYGILIVLVSMLSLSIPYLARFAVFGSNWTIAHTRMLRLVLNLPMIVLFFVFLVWDIVTSFLDTLSTGIGAGLALCFAGALLAASPRRSELVGLPQEKLTSTIWRAVAFGLVGVVCIELLVGLINAIRAWTDSGIVGISLDPIGNMAGYGLPLGVEVVIYLCFLAVSALLLLVPAAALMGRTRWHLVLLGLVIVYGISLLGEGIFADAPFEFASQGGVFLALFVAIAVVCWTPVIIDRQEPEERPGLWLKASQSGMAFAAVFFGISIVELIAVFIGFEAKRGAVVGLLVLCILLVLASLVGRAALVRDPAQGRRVAVIIGVLYAVLGIAMAIVTGVANGGVPVSVVMVIFGLSAGLIALMTAPPSMRETFGPLLPTAAPGYGGQGAVPRWNGQPAQGQMPPPPAGQPMPDARYTPQQTPVVPPPAFEAQPPAPAGPAYTYEAAADPTTDPRTLVAIAQTTPALRAVVASNPSLTFEMSQTLRAMGDDTVNTILDARFQEPHD